MEWTQLGLDNVKLGEHTAQPFSWTHRSVYQRRIGRPSIEYCGNRPVHAQEDDIHVSEVPAVPVESVAHQKLSSG